MSEPFATVTDVINRYKLLTSEETAKAEVLLRDVSSALRIKAKECNRDLDAMMAEDEDYANVVEMVTCDIVIRRLDQDSSSNTYNLQQESQSALGYTWSGTYVNTGGGISILDKDLKKLGLRKQKASFIDFYGVGNAAN